MTILEHAAAIYSIKFNQVPRYNFTEPFVSYLLGELACCIAAEARQEPTLMRKDDTPSSTFEDRFGEWDQYMGAVREQTDLGYVLITAAYLEEQLSRILQVFMVDGRVTKDMLSGPSAVMGSFSDKTHLAFTLGLIDEVEYKSINGIRTVRNEFAHNITTRFTSDKVRSRMDALCWAVGKEKLGKSDAQQVFQIASQRLIMQLLNRSDHVIKERRSNKAWPVERTDADPDLDIRDMIY